MKSKILLMPLISLALFSCFRKNKKDQPDKITPFAVFPFFDLSLTEAKAQAIEEKKQLLVLIISPHTEVSSVIRDIGLDGKEKDQSFQREYLPILLTTEMPEAKALIDSMYIRAFPAVLTYYKGHSQPSRLQYGRPWPGSKEYLTPKLTAPLFQAYLDGDKDPRLLRQLLDHFLYLPLTNEKAETWKLQIKDDYLATFSLDSLKSYESYQMLQREVTDIRLNIVDVLFKNREVLNQYYGELATERGSKRPMSADWILLKALRTSYETAARETDASLFQKSETIREQYESGYLDEWIARSIFLYYLGSKENLKARQAAVDYFTIKKNWATSREYGLMEAGARLVVEHAQDTSEWQQAERWISKAVSGRATPSRLALHIQILNQLGEKDKVFAVRQKLQEYQSAFEEFLSFYPEKPLPIELDTQKVKKKDLKSIPALPTEFRFFYEYISLEGSLFKKGEKVEPIALLSRGEKEVILLSRVHLVTTSLLPVTHIKSYYVATRFSPEGSYLGSQYEHRKIIEL